MTCVIPNNVEEPSEVILRSRRGVPRLRFAALGMTEK